MPRRQAKAGVEVQLPHRTQHQLFIGLNAADEYPQTFLASDRNLTTNDVPVGPGLLAVTTNAVLGWSATMHGNRGKLGLSDGSVQPTTDATLKVFNRHQGIGTNWLAMP